ncbi:hypothetical protein [Crocosphaera sp.]|uniref:hypothetical protein n=1 Tax=Crocosphaera sp. TaxID=2729996 RepID=UPI002623C3DB|nr:hypothetical protein [Crocosphaera sp.]MDJ0582375.1 hypothetical protein [Crocosphaera sp.]
MKTNTTNINQNTVNTIIPSLQEIAKLSLEERHKLLSPIIQEIAKDINNDPELNLFSQLDGEGLEDNKDL